METPILNDSRVYGLTGGTVESSRSAVSWAAILAGAFVIVATSLILLALGSAFGFAAISPWSGRGISFATFTATMAVWLVVVQWLSSALGGYIAGRLRTKWSDTHTDEVFFRDTAHGLLTWAVSLVVGLVALAGVAASGANTAAQTATAAAAVAPTASTIANSYDMDILLRPGAPGASVQAVDVRDEVARILIKNATSGDVSPADRAYLAQLVAARAGISPADAQSRVDVIIAQEQADIARAKQLADQTRKAAAGLALGTALSMLIGAFIASVAAAMGGRLRDLHP